MLLHECYTAHYIYFKCLPYSTITDLMYIGGTV